MPGRLLRLRLSLVEVGDFGEDTSRFCLSCLSGTSQVSSCSSSCNVFGRNGTFGLHIPLISYYASIQQLSCSTLTGFLFYEPAF